MLANQLQDHETVSAFLQDRAPMHRARGRAALDRLVRADGVVMSRGALVRLELRAGARVVAGTRGRELAETGERDIFRAEAVLTATAMDYAAFLEMRILEAAGPGAKAVIERAELALQAARKADKAWWTTRDPATVPKVEGDLRRGMARVARLRTWVGRRARLLD